MTTYDPTTKAGSDRSDDVSRSGRQAGSSPTVGVIVDPVYSHGRGILRGITTYGLGHAWQFRRPTGWFFDALPDILSWRVDGLIASLHDESMVAFVRTMNVPTVNIASSYSYGDWPSAICDNHLIGKMAAQHYVDRGLRSLAYVGHPTARWSTERFSGFESVIQEVGLTCQVCPFNVFARTDGGSQSSGFRQWLATLPPQTGVFAGNDSIAEIVLATALEAGLNVPEQLAVVGVDNDEMTAQMTTPALTSVDANSERIGHEAARILESMLNGASPPTEPIRIPPIGVVARASSDVLALADDDVRSAVRFIRDHAASPISVDDVLAEVPLSRRPLEKRFRKVLGRSILDEIHRVHVERAAQLLVGTDLSMPDVARASGFATYTRMGIVFRKLTGRSPTGHRSQFRPTRAGYARLSL